MSETRLELQIVENSKSAISALDNLVSALNRVNTAVARGTNTKFDTKGIDSAVGHMKSQLEAVAPAASQAAKESKGLSEKLKELFSTASGAKKNTNGLLSSFARIAKYRFLRAVLKEITTGFKEGFENMYNYAKYIGHSFAPAVDSAKDALFKMKNSIGAALAPALQMVIPYVVQLVNWFIELVNWVNQFLALLRGQSTWTRATDASASTLDKVKDSAKGASSAVKELKGLLADWDELNIIQQETGGGSGSGSKTAADEDLSKYGLLFEEVNTFDDRIKGIVGWIQDHLDEIRLAAISIGGALLAWRLGRAFVNGLGTTIRQIVGIAISIYGVIEAIKAFKDQWKNGIDIQNMQKMLSSIGIGILGLGIAFGVTGIAIGAIAGGIALIINPLKELIETGKLTDEALGQLSIGVVVAAAGISLLTGSWIPLLISGVGVAAAWVAQKWDWLTENVFNPIGDFFAGIWNDISSWWTSDVQPSINESVSWINDNIIKPIGGFFEALWGTIKGDTENNLGTWWDGLWKGTMFPIVSWVDENITSKIGKFFEDLWWSFTETDAVKSAISWFSGLWEKGKGFAKGIESISTNIIEYAKAEFELLWKSFADSDLVTSAVSWWGSLWGEDGKFASVLSAVQTAVVDPIVTKVGSVWESFKDSEIVTTAISWWESLWGPSGQLATAASNIKTNIVDPIGTFIGSVWEYFKETPEYKTAEAWWSGLWGEDGAIANATKSIETNVLNPIGEFFTDLWGKFTESEAYKSANEWWTNLWSEEGFIASAINGVNERIFEPIGKFFTQFWENFKGTESGQTIVQWWEGLWGESGQIATAAKDIETTIIEPISSSFSTLGTNIQKFMSDPIENIKTAWKDVKTWFHKNITLPIANFFISAMNSIISSINVMIRALNSLNITIPSLPHVWDETRIGFNIGEIELLAELQEIQEEAEETSNALSNVGIDTNQWIPSQGRKKHIVGNADTSFLIPEVPDLEYELDIDESSFDVDLPAPNTELFVSGIQDADEEFNKAVDDIIDAASSLDGMNFSFTYEGQGYGYWNGSQPRPKKFADGGLVTTGELFIAREAGPEMVGTMGHHTAVANNGQIVEGVASGVAAGQAEQNALLRQQNDYLRRLLSKDFKAVVHPSADLGRVNRMSEEMYERNTGTAVM